MEDLEPWPSNLAAWETYQRVAGALTLEGGTLDLAGAIATLEWTGRAPEAPEQRQDLIDGWLIIHHERLKAARGKKGGDDQES